MSIPFANIQTYLEVVYARITRSRSIFILVYPSTARGQQFSLRIAEQQRGSGNSSCNITAAAAVVLAAEAAVVVLAAEEAVAAASVVVVVVVVVAAKAQLQ